MTGTRAAVHDLSPDLDTFLRDVLSGLSASPKHLPAKYFYDRNGCRLFDAICELPEYYLTRTELAILEASVGEMAAALGERPLLVELGSGSGLKTRMLLGALADPAAYVPVDIAHGELQTQAAQLAISFPQLEVLPVCADYTRPFQLPIARRRTPNVCFYFPGSTIGNLEPDEARRFLRHLRRMAGGPCKLLLGVDLKKDVRRLEAAYNDVQGVTAAFNLNLLTRINAELGANFVPASFEHLALYDAQFGRIEMHLVSTCAQTVRLDRALLELEQGERICTEHSYKYSPAEIARLALSCGFEARVAWRDPEQLFSVELFEAA